MENLISDEIKNNKKGTTDVASRSKLTDDEEEDDGDKDDDDNNDEIENDSDDYCLTQIFEESPELLISHNCGKNEDDNNDDDDHNCGVNYYDNHDDDSDGVNIDEMKNKDNENLKKNENKDISNRNYGSLCSDKDEKIEQLESKDKEDDKDLGDNNNKDGHDCGDDEDDDDDGHIADLQVTSDKLAKKNEKVDTDKNERGSFKTKEASKKKLRDELRKELKKELKEELTKLKHEREKSMEEEESTDSNDSSAESTPESEDSDHSRWRRREGVGKRRPRKNKGKNDKKGKSVPQRSHSDELETRRIEVSKIIDWGKLKEVGDGVVGVEIGDADEKFDICPPRLKTFEEIEEDDDNKLGVARNFDARSSTVDFASFKKANDRKMKVKEEYRLNMENELLREIKRKNDEVEHLRAENEELKNEKMDNEELNKNILKNVILQQTRLENLELERLKLENEMWEKLRVANAELEKLRQENERLEKKNSELKNLSEELKLKKEKDLERLTLQREELNKFKLENKELKKFKLNNIEIRKSKIRNANQEQLTIETEMERLKVENPQIDILRIKKADYEKLRLKLKVLPHERTDISDLKKKGGITIAEKKETGDREEKSMKEIEQDIDVNPQQRICRLLTKINACHRVQICFATNLLTESSEKVFQKIAQNFESMKHYLIQSFTKLKLEFSFVFGNGYDAASSVDFNDIRFDIGWQKHHDYLTTNFKSLFEKINGLTWMKDYYRILFFLVDDVQLFMDRKTDFEIICNGIEPHQVLFTSETGWINPFPLFLSLKLNKDNVVPTICILLKMFLKAQEGETFKKEVCGSSRNYRTLSGVIHYYKLCSIIPLVEQCSLTRDDVKTINLKENIHLEVDRRISGDNVWMVYKAYHKDEIFTIKRLRKRDHLNEKEMIFSLLESMSTSNLLGNIFNAKNASEKKMFFRTKNCLEEKDAFYLVSPGGHDIACGSDCHSDETLTAFSHWTHHITDGFLLVEILKAYVESQTIDVAEVAVHCTDESAYRMTNLSTAGIERFFSYHDCNSICDRLKLRIHPKQVKMPLSELYLL